MLGVAVEDPGGEFARGAVAEELKVVGMIAELDERAAVRGDVGVSMAVGVAGVIGFLGAAAENEGEEKGEGEAVESHGGGSGMWR